MLYKKVIAYSKSQFSVAMLREHIKSSQVFNLDEMVSRYGRDAVWNSSWQVMHHYIFQLSISKGNESPFSSIERDKFFCFFKDLVELMPVGTIDPMVETLERLELRKEIEEGLDENSRNVRLIYKKLIVFLKDCLSKEAFDRLERRQLLNGLCRHDSTLRFPTESTMEYLKIKQFVDKVDVLFDGKKVDNFDAFCRYLEFEIKDISSDLRTAMVFYLLKRGYSHFSNNKQWNRMLRIAIDSLSSIDKAQAILYILRMDERQDAGAIYTNNAHNCGRQFVRLLDDLGITSEKGPILQLYSIFSMRDINKKNVLMAYMREFCVNPDNERLSLSELVERLDSLVQVPEVKLAGAKRLQQADQSCGLVVCSFANTDRLSRFSVGIMDTAWMLASLMSMTGNNTVNELLDAIFEVIKDIEPKKHGDALKLILTLYLEGADINNILEIIASNPKMYKDSVVEFIANEDVVLKVEVLAQKEGIPFVEVYTQLLNTVVNSDDKVTAADIEDFFEFIRQSGCASAEITVANLVNYFKTIQLLYTVELSEDDKDAGQKGALPVNREQVAKSKEKVTLPIEGIIKSLMKVENLTLGEAMNRVQSSKMFNEGTLHDRKFVFNLCIPLLESGWELERIEQLSFKEIIGKNTFMLNLSASSIETLMTGCLNTEDIQAAITRVSNGIVGFVDDIGKKIDQMQHGFHEAGGGFHEAGGFNDDEEGFNGDVNAAAAAGVANRIKLRNAKLRAEALKVVSVLLANGISVDDIFGDNRNGLIYRLGINATNVRIDSSKEYSRLCLAWSRNIYLRHNQHAMIQLQRLATTNVSVVLLKKLLEIVEQNGKNDPRKIVELTSMITSYYALNKADKDSSLMEDLLGDINITDLYRLLTLDKSKAKQVFEGGLNGELLDMLKVWRNKLIDIFSSEYEIPKEVFLESKLENEKLQEALMYFSLLGSNKKIRTQNKTMFKYMVIVELLGKTNEVKSGIPQHAILEKYFPSVQREEFSKMSFKDFPFIDNTAMMAVWLAEGQKNVLVNQTMVSPSQEVNNILHLVEAAIDHLSDTFKVLRRGYEIIKDAAKYKQTLAGIGRDLSRAMSSGDTRTAAAICPEIPGNMVGKNLKETYDRVVARQQQVSLYDSLDDLVKAREGFFEFLGRVDQILDGIEGHKALLDAIGYNMTYSPGIFMWTGELQLLRKRLEKPETLAIIKQHGLQPEVEELMKLITAFDGVRKSMYKYIDSYKNQIEKTIAKLQELNETEAVNQLVNAVGVIDSSKQATSQVYSIMDLTSIYRILAVLKEDNTCLSPTSTINPHTNLSFLDPNRKMLAVMDENGHLVCNMLLTLGTFNNIPCLVMDNIYSKNNPAQYYPAIIQYLMEKFETIGLPVVVTDKVRGSKELGFGIDVQDAEIILPEPQHGSGYHESNGGYTVYDNILVIKGDCVVFYPNFDLRVKKKGAILKKLEKRDYYDIFRGIVSTDKLYKMKLIKAEESSFDLEVTDELASSGTTTIKVNLDEVNRQDGTVALNIGLEIMRKDDEDKEKVSNPLLHPGQTHKGASLKVISQLFRNLQKFAEEHKFDMLMADPEFYQTYILLKRAGFQFDPQAELTPHYETLLGSIDEAFDENKVRSIRQRSEMIQSGQIVVGDEVFHWPEEKHRIFMIYPFKGKTPEPEAH